MNLPLDASETPEDRVAFLGAWLRRSGARRVWVVGHKREVRALVEAALTGLDRPTEGGVDLAVLTPLSVDEAVYFAQKAVSRLGHSGLLAVVRAGTDTGTAAADAEEEAMIRAMGDHGFEPGDAGCVAGLRVLGFQMTRGPRSAH